jgi:hypothetical protein
MGSSRTRVMYAVSAFDRPRILQGISKYIYAWATGGKNKRYMHSFILLKEPLDQFVYNRAIFHTLVWFQDLDTER